MKDSEEVDGLVTLQERMVNLINQLQMPLIEVSMVIGNHIKQLMRSLEEHITKTGSGFPTKVTSPWPLTNDSNSISNTKMDLEKIISIVDDDRMDILTTLIRVTVEELRITLFDLMILLRSWEQMLKERLSKLTSPGQLFSPVSMPDGF